MPSDIVLPRGNEKQLIDMALRLSYSRLYLGYTLKDWKARGTEQIRKIKNGSKTSNTCLDVQPAIITSSLNEIKKGRSTGSPIIFSLKRPERISPAMRNTLVLGFELSPRHDFIFQRNAGVDEPSCRIAAENNICFGFSFQDILKAREPAVIMGRMAQNINLYRKHKLGCVFASLAQEPYDMRSPADLASLLVCLGMQPNKAKECLEQGLEWQNPQL